MHWSSGLPEPLGPLQSIESFAESWRQASTSGRSDESAAAFGTSAGGPIRCWQSLESSSNFSFTHARRSGDPASHWLARLTLHPLVELERGGATAPYRAIARAEPEARRAVNEAMARKYGAADRFVRSFVDVERSVPVQLEPIEGLGHSPGH